MSMYKITVNGKSYDVNVEPLAGAAAVAAPQAAPVAAAPVAAPVPAPAPQAAPAPVAAPAAAAPAANDNLLILEAMKMENEIPAGRDGKVLEIRVSEGSAVNSGDVLVVIG